MGVHRDSQKATMSPNLAANAQLLAMMATVCLLVFVNSRIPKDMQPNFAVESCLALTILLNAIWGVQALYVRNQSLSALLAVEAYLISLERAQEERSVYSGANPGLPEMPLPTDAGGGAPVRPGVLREPGLRGDHVEAVPDAAGEGQDRDHDPEPS